ncbi:PD-(D/E)XK nuclease-like domain-containing protein [Flavobacterium crassostreae]|uniref:Putative exodeoxyribonuclease 8 PDDEXK-like domain-containing protein n=1 Tax=Flavobacterium crassostreae TaxID=1763534 RepID=A0A1B9E7R5_9FLAO|nr:PD-(D/E)XK nuclease-like domain-containing protein [Flavobacterium crassostreae]OCB77994.1 hypothetical protein LPBF_03330 [Flavobacterium crassostreae]
MDPYFGRNEVSNSDLSWLKDYWSDNKMDEVSKEKAYKFGTLIDAVITEPFKVDYFKFQVDGVQYSEEDFEKAILMKKAFMKDPLAENLLKQSDTQKVMITNRTFTYDEVEFNLDTRCKWDLWMDGLGWGGDLKSTTATTQKQFEEAVRYFDYDRQRAWYMDIAGSNQDVLIGVSKENYKVFKVPIRRGDELFNSGFKKYNELAFKWWALFD